MRFNSKKYPLLASDNWFNYIIPDQLIHGPAELHNKSTHSARLFNSILKKKLDGLLNILFSKTGNSFGYVSKKFRDDAVLNQDKFSSLEFCDEISNTSYKLLIDGMIYVGCYPIWGAIFDKENLLCFSRQVNSKRFSYADSCVPISYDDPAWFWSILLPRSILLFKKYAPHKTKILPPRGKIKEFHCRYKSDLDIGLDLYTENWYTESIQKMPYNVREHLRWQRVGKGRKKRRLTWVKPHIRCKYKKGAYMDLE